MQAADDAQRNAGNAPVGAASGNRERCQIAVQLSQATTASAHLRQHRKRHQLRHQLARFQRALSDQPPCPLQMTRYGVLTDAADHRVGLLVGDVGNDYAATLIDAFERYLVHGGYLTAINDMEVHGRILPATFAVYCDWIRGGMRGHGKQERFLAEILGSVIRRYGSQVTWHSLAADRSIDHPMTVADYVQLLAQMDVLIVQHALREDRLTAAPKKARKVVLSDPFIFHAVRSWLDPVDDPFTAQTGPAVANREWAGKLAEACAAAHHYRMHPTYYIKGDGEVDIAFVSGATFSPIEVKWTSQVRSTDLKQARKYRNSVICSRIATADRIHGLPNELLPLHLQRLGPSPYYVTW